MDLHISNYYRLPLEGLDRRLSFILENNFRLRSVRLTKILAKNLGTGWSRLLIVPDYKKEQKTFCDNHRGISLTNIMSKMIVSIILRNLTRAHGGKTRLVAVLGVNVWIRYSFFGRLWNRDILFDVRLKLYSLTLREYSSWYSVLVSIIETRTDEEHQPCTGSLLEH